MIRFKHRLLGLVLAGLAIGITACAGSSVRLPGGQRLQQQKGAAVLERKSGRIVYIGIDGNIYVTDQTGAQQTQITSDAVSREAFFLQYRLPTWSPDSSEIAFIGESGPGENNVASDTVVYSVSPEGGVLKEKFISDRDVLFYLYWSPDGQYVSFISQDTEVGTLEVQAVASEGPNRDSLTLGAGSTVYFTWAPDGDSLLMHIDGLRRTGTLGAVQVHEFLDRSPEIEELPYTTGAFQAPAWSPDGTKMLFATRGEEDQDRLVVTDSRGLDPRVITEYEGKVAFAWAPNSRHVAYITSDDISLAQGFGIGGSLHVYDLRRNEQISFDEEEPVLAFFWSPDGTRLAYFAPRTVTNEETGESGRILGINIAVIRSGETYELFQFVPPDAFLNMLTFFDQHARSATIWSPDSEYVVFPVAFEGASVVAVMHASGSIDPRPIGRGTLAFWSWE